MTATEVLRRMLDERGVEWEDATPVPSMKPWKTSFTSFTGEEVTISVYDEPKWLMGTLVFHTPEQAIAATLGDADATGERQGDAGTCHDEGDPSDFCCSECGVRMFTDTSDTYTMIASDGRTIIKHPNYCPNCGRRVEQ